METGTVAVTFLPFLQKQFLQLLTLELRILKTSEDRKTIYVAY